MDKRIKLEIKLPLVKDIELVAIEGLELMGRHLQISMFTHLKMDALPLLLLM